MCGLVYVMHIIINQLFRGMGCEGAVIFGLSPGSSLLVWGVRWAEELALQAVKQLSTVFLWGFLNWKEGLFVGDVEQQEKKSQ